MAPYNKLQCHPEFNYIRKNPKVLRGCHWLYLWKQINNAPKAVGSCPVSWFYVAKRF